MNHAKVLLSVLCFFITAEVNAQTGGKELPARAAANDANGDGLLQKNEADGREKSNFVAIDCDKRRLYFRCSEDIGPIENASGPF